MDDRRKEDDRLSRPQQDVEKTPATDPQERMEGPISSLMHSAGESFDSNESKEEADQKKEEKM